MEPLWGKAWCGGRGRSAAQGELSAWKLLSFGFQELLISFVALFGQSGAVAHVGEEQNVYRAVEEAGQVC